MKYFLSILPVFLSLILCHCSSSDLKITYIGNEGFLIETGNKKILSDALWGEMENTAYEVPSDSLTALMREAKAPFDKIDLISISHKHQDHFNADITLAHLLNDPGTRCVAPEQTAALLREHAADKTICSRIHGISLPPFSDSTFSLRGIDIRALRLAHSPYMETDPQSGLEVNRHRDEVNLGYLFRVGNAAIFHGGDSNPLDSSGFATFALQDEDLDVAFLDRLFLFRGETPQMIMQRYIQARHTVFMHISPANAPRIAPYFKDDSTVSVFTAPLESITLKF
ncbi:MAG: MBL fold metallo-hydrolase [Candidatus Marinimicrobia bacterium]|nr:MBL fold metallo-hydrolase [Candidatus Neomarinimicrobiota bacterium]